MPSYDIYSYARMVRDEVRTGAYAEALRRSVTNDSIVLDMGTGVGIWALLACQFGARKVYAIEPNDVVHVAQKIAAVNGFGDRIQFIQDFSTNVTLAEKADIVITEMHGIVPMFEHNLPSIIDARRRLLAPGGVTIPKKETLWVMPVSAPCSFDEAVQPWASNVHGLRWQPALNAAANSWFKIKDQITAADGLAAPACWATLDYETLDHPNVAGGVTLTAEKNGTAHGLAVWFETTLIDGVGFSNAPGQPATIFGQGFFPWPNSVEIAGRDQISVGLRADWLRGYHLWRWNTTILDGRDQQVKFKFRQSNIFALPISRAEQERSDNSLSQLNESGQFVQLVFSLMNGNTRIDEIARQAIARFPGRFNGLLAAKNAVAKLADKYGN